MATTTTTLGLTKPATGDRAWGQTMNANLDAIDAGLVPRSGGSFNDATGTAVFHTGTAHGTQLGGSAAELLAFYGAAPLAQPAGAGQAVLTDNSGGDVSAFTLDPASIPTTLTDNSGGTASGTIAAATNTSVLTDGTTGTASTTVGDVGSTFNQSSFNNIHASFIARWAEQRALNSVMINTVASLAAKVNGNIAALQKVGNNVSRLARLQTAIRSALVALGLMKGSA